MRDYYGWEDDARRFSTSNSPYINRDIQPRNERWLEVRGDEYGNRSELERLHDPYGRSAVDHHQPYNQRDVFLKPRVTESSTERGAYIERPRERWIDERWGSSSLDDRWIIPRPFWNSGSCNDLQRESFPRDFECSNNAWPKESVWSSFSGPQYGNTLTRRAPEWSDHRVYMSESNIRNKTHYNDTWRDTATRYHTESKGRFTSDEYRDDQDPLIYSFRHRERSPKGQHSNSGNEKGALIENQKKKIEKPTAPSFSTERQRTSYKANESTNTIKKEPLENDNTSIMSGKRQDSHISPTDEHGHIEIKKQSIEEGHTQKGPNIYKKTNENKYGIGYRGTEETNRTRNELIIRHDLSHDDIHHFKPLSYKRMKGTKSTNSPEKASTSGDRNTITIEKQDSLAAPKCDTPEKQGTDVQNKYVEWKWGTCKTADDISQIRVHSPILDPQNYVEELSNPDIDDLVELEELAKEFGESSAAKSSNVCREGYTSQPFQRDSLKQTPSIASDLTGQKRLLEPGLDEPAAKKQQHAPSDGMISKKQIATLLQKPDLTVEESIAAVTSSLAPSEIIAEVAQKGLADALLSNETLKERIKKVYEEEIRKLLSNPQIAPAQHCSRRDDGHDRTKRECRDDQSSCLLPIYSSNLSKNPIVETRHRSDPSPGPSHNIFPYNGPIWRMKNKNWMLGTSAPHAERYSHEPFMRREYDHDFFDQRSRYDPPGMLGFSRRCNPEVNNPYEFKTSVRHGEARSPVSRVGGRYDPSFYDFPRRDH